MRDVWRLIDWLGNELEGLLPEGYQPAGRESLTAERTDATSESPAA
jgi:hypothetical protein